MLETAAGELNRNELIEKNLPLVGYQGAELLRRVPSFVQREDLASAGSLALVQAANSYDPSTGVPFHRYAVHRIRGAMLDELRSMDWATRGARQRTKQLEEMTATFTAAEGRAPTKEELASALGVDVEAVEAAQQDAARRIVSMDAPSSNENDDRGMDLPDEAPSPEEAILEDERLIYLRASVRALSPKLRFIVEQVFFAERPIQDVADELGVTQSRVSQLRSEALALIRDGMNRHLDPEMAGEDADNYSGIVKKRRETYFQKIADHAEDLQAAGQPPSSEETLTPTPVPLKGSGSHGRAHGSSLRDSLSAIAPSGTSSEPARPDTSPAAHGSSSTQSFIAGHTKETAEAKAKLHAESEARRAAEEEKHKSQDKPTPKTMANEPEKPEEEEKEATPPTTSYLGGLSIRQQNMRAEARKRRKIN